MLEGLQHSKLSYSSRSDSESPLHSLPAGNALASPGYGDRGSLAPHSAWEALLNTRLPFLLSENQAATDFLGLLRGARHQLSGKIASSGAQELVKLRWLYEQVLFRRFCLLGHALQRKHGFKFHAAVMMCTLEPFVYKVPEYALVRDQTSACWHATAS